MINFNELLAKDLAQYLTDNQDWFLEKDYGGSIIGIDEVRVKEVITSYFKSHDEEVPALLRKK